MINLHNFGQSLNYYSKKYITQNNQKRKQKKPSKNQMADSKFKQFLLPVQEAKERNLEISYDIQINQCDDKQRQNYLDDEIVDFFYDESRISASDVCKCLKQDHKQSQVLQTAQNTPYKEEFLCKMNQQSNYEINHQNYKQKKPNGFDFQQKSQQITLTQSDIKKVLSQPQIQSSIYQIMEPVPRRKTDCVKRTKEYLLCPKKNSDININKFLKRFNNYDVKNESKIKAPLLKKITEKSKEDSAN